MKKFSRENRIFIKSNNSTDKILNRYTYVLIVFLLYIIGYNLILGSVSVILSLLKSLFIVISLSILIEYVFSLTNKEKNIKKIFQNNNIFQSSIILSIFLVGMNPLIMIVSTIISSLIKHVFKNINTSSCLYGILFILIYKYYTNDLITPLTNLASLNYTGSYDSIVTPFGNILKYITGINYNYLSPILGIIAFIYLFNKKSIKYNIVISYIITIFTIMLFIGLFNNMNIWYVAFQLLTGNLLFLSVFCLPDYAITPTSNEGQLIYGIILGIISSILRFIIPELSIVVTMILGPIILTKLINIISFKLRYKKPFYYMTVSVLAVIVIITSIVITIII